MAAVSGSRTAVIAEDDPDVRDLIQVVLSQSGFFVVLADDGPSAIEAVRRHDPMLTTLDVNMPGMDGFAVAKELREFSHTYLIFITSLAEEVDIIRGFEAGADDYLVKPFRPRELRARADSMLRRASYAQAAAAEAEPEPEPESWAAKAAREFREQMGGGLEPIAPPEPGSPVASPSQPYVGKRARRADPAPAPQQAQPVPPPQPAQPTYQPEPAPQPAYEQQPYQQPVPQQPAYEPAYQQPVQQPVPPQPAQPVYQQPVQQPGYQQPLAPQPVAPAAQPVAHHDVLAPGGGDGVVEQGGQLYFNGLSVDVGSGIATLGGRRLDLSRPESDLLVSLLRTGRRVRSKADLVLAMRGHEYVTSHFVNEADKRQVEHHIGTLRRKLGDDGATPTFIETVKGVGFRLATAV
ncbi:MAG: two-component system response regulator [Nocardioides sp.]|nr:two-component system response regulator [Nocardioides sp.]